MSHCDLCSNCGMEKRPRIDGPCQAKIYYQGSLRVCGQPRGAPFGDRPEHKYAAGFAHIVPEGGPCVCGHDPHGEACEDCLKAAWQYGMIDMERALRASHHYLGATIELDHEAE